MRVYVVTGLDLGWDCVCAVYTGVDEATIRKEWPEDRFVITEMGVETEVVSSYTEDEEE